MAGGGRGREEFCAGLISVHGEQVGEEGYFLLTLLFC